MHKLLRINDEVDTTPVDAHVSKTKSLDNAVYPLCTITCL